MSFKKFGIFFANKQNFIGVSFFKTAVRTIAKTTSIDHA